MPLEPINFRYFEKNPGNETPNNSVGWHLIGCGNAFLFVQIGRSLPCLQFAAFGTGRLGFLLGPAGYFASCRFLKKSGSTVFHIPV